MFFASFTLSICIVSGFSIPGTVLFGQGVQLMPTLFVSLLEEIIVYQLMLLSNCELDVLVFF